MATLSAEWVFQNNWFYRDSPKLDLTKTELLFIKAALGESPERWLASPDVSQMNEILASEPSVLDRIGERLMSVASGMRGTAKTIKLLAENNVALNFDPAIYNTLHEAAWAGATETLEAIFKTGLADATTVSVEKPHTGWPGNLSLMYWAAWGGFAELAELLIKFGVGVHHELEIKGNGERGTTSLQEAIAPGPWKENQADRIAGKLKVAQILIDDGAFYDVYSACGRNDNERLKQLVDEDSTIAKRADVFGMTPLHWAARAGAVDCATTLLANGANVNAQNNGHRVPLHLASDANDEDMIRLLARRNADLNAQDRKGRTPLHRATYEGSAAAAEALLGIGADSMVLNKNGKTAFEIARKDAKYLKELARN